MPPPAQRSGVSTSGRADVRARAEVERIGINETELLRCVVAGERWAAEALYDLVYPSIAASLQRVLHSPSHDYDDLVQTTFERLIRSVLARGEAVLSLAAWASGIATHTALDALRARIRERKYFQSEDAGGGALLAVAGSVSEEQQLEARRQLRIVQELLGRMKPAEAETVVLHDMIGHDLAETAALTAVSVAAAQSRLVRGRKELRRRVEQRLARGAK